jgi:multiple sugar transport system substrate-binding protein
MKSRGVRRGLATLGFHAVAVAVAAVFVVPGLWVLAASLRQPGLPPSRAIEWLPDPVSWSNYARIFEILPLGWYLANSLLIAGLAIPLTVLVASWAGFAMAQLPPRARYALLALAVILRMTPLTALWLTRFLVLKELHMIDTIWALLAPVWMGSSPFFVLIFYWAFRRQPAALIDAARLEGMSAVGIWASIAMPLARPAIAAVSLLAFVQYWSDFISPLLYLKSESGYTLALGLRMLQQLDATGWPLLMAGAVVMILPVLLLLFVVQRAFWPEAGLRAVRRAAWVVLAAAALWPAPAAAQPPSGRISFMVFGDLAEKAAYEELVAEFTRRVPQVQVTLLHIPGQSDYRKRLGVDFAAGTPADVVLLNYRRYGAFAARGVLEPLGPYLAQSGVLDERQFYPEALAPFRWQGMLTCIPQNLSSLVVYYNRTLFEHAGVPRPRADWSWDDFLSAARTLTRDTDGDGRIDRYGLGTEVSIFRLAPFVWQNGGELVDDTRAPTRLTLDTPAAREAVQWFVDLQVKHRVVPDAVEEKAEGSESRFLNGRLGMLLNSRRGVPTYRTITRFDWDVAPLPRRHARAGILHADAYCLPKASRAKAAAWAFIEFANSPDGQRTIAASGRTVPSLRAVAESPAFLDPGGRPQSSRVFLDEIPFIRAVPVIGGWVDIEELAAEELARAYYGRAGVDEVLATAARRALPFFAPPGAPRR